MDGYKQPDPADAGKAIDLDANDDGTQTLAQMWQEQATSLQDEANLVDWFLKVPEEGNKFLGSLAKQVSEDFDEAWDSAADYRDKRRKNLQILTGFLPPKDGPIENGANAHTPLFLERWLRLVSNVFVELFQDREAIFGVEPTGPDDYEEAELLTIHGHWQLENELTDFFRQQERGLGEFFGAGSVFCHSWRDTTRNRNRHDILTCEDFVFPYVHSSVEVDMSDIPWKAKIIRKYRPEIEDLRDNGEWSNVETVLAKEPPAWDILETRVRDQGANQEGIKPSEKSKKSPYVFTEYHGWCRMPGDKRQRAICVTVDKQTKTVVRFYIREEEDWRDLARHGKQTQELDAYHKDTQDHASAQQKEMELRMHLSHPGIHPDDAATMHQALDAEPIPPPTPPTWLSPGNTGPAPIRRVPIEMFAHGVCIENPYGALGLSPGSILADLNRLADDAYNAVYDQASLANASTLITPDNIDFGSSRVQIGPGKHLKVKGVTGDQLKNSLVELKPGQANQQLLDIVRFAKEDGDSSVAAPGILSGEAGKSGETFRGLATRQEAAKRQLSKAGLKYTDFLSQILKNNARLNAMFMPDEEIIAVLDHYREIRKHTVDEMGNPVPEVHISRDMYRRNYKVTFTADMRFAPQAQRVSEADEVLAMASSVPPLQGDMAFIHRAITKSLRARNQHDMIPTLGPPPPAPTTPLGSAPPPPPGMAPPGGPPGQPPPHGPPAPGGPPSPLAGMPQQGGFPADGLPPAAQGPIQGPPQPEDNGQ